jgi:hypothetical protein
MSGDSQNQRSGVFTSRTVLLVFSICALADFIWSMLESRSVIESAISALFGLVGTAWYLLVIWASSRNDPNDPNEPARWVP